MDIEKLYHYEISEIITIVGCASIGVGIFMNILFGTSLLSLLLFTYGLLTFFHESLYCLRHCRNIKLKNGWTMLVPITIRILSYTAIFVVLFAPVIYAITVTVSYIAIFGIFYAIWLEDGVSRINGWTIKVP